MSTDKNDTADHEDESLDDTLDGEESLDEWVTRRTHASSTGRLTPDDVMDVYTEETGREADPQLIARVLAHHYQTITTHGGELAFCAALPY